MFAIAEIEPFQSVDEMCMRHIISEDEVSSSLMSLCPCVCRSVFLHFCMSTQVIQSASRVEGGGSRVEGGSSVR